MAKSTKNDVLKKNNIKHCYVRLIRNREIEKLAKDYAATESNGRRSSQRLKEKLTQPKFDVATSSKPIRRARANSVFKQRSKNNSRAEFYPNQNLTPVKTILVKNSKPNVKRMRSKSVTFDVSPFRSTQNFVDDGQRPSTSNQSTADTLVSQHAAPSAASPAQESDQSVQRMRSKSVDQRPSTSEQSTAHTMVSQIVAPLAAFSAPVLSTGDARSFEMRIAGLIDSNNTKINRIELLQAERDSLLNQIAVMNKLNKSMASTIDGFRKDENNQGNAASNESMHELRSENDRLKLEISDLKQRIERLNNAYFGLSGQHDDLKKKIQSYSLKVLGEHNYNLNQ